MKATLKDNEQFTIYNDMFLGYKISSYGLDHGRLDYKTLFDAMTEGNAILNNDLIEKIDDFEIWAGSDWTEDEDGEEIYVDVFQWYIITERSAKDFARFTDEIIYYSPSLDLYMVGITHWGTSWDYVLTDYVIE